MRRKGKFVIIGLIVLFIILGGIYHTSKTTKVDKCISELLLYNGIKKTQIVKVGNYKNITYKKIYYEVQKEDIDEVVQATLESYTEILPYKDKTKAERGDIVCINYQIYDNGKMVENAENEKIKLGNYVYGEELEEQLLGCEVGNTYQINTMTPPIIENDSISGKAVTFKISVLSLWYDKCYDLNDDFVQEKLNYSSVEKYLDAVKTDLEEKNEQRAYTQENYDILNQVVEHSQYELNVDEISEYALQIVQMYAEVANIYGFSTEQYTEEFYEKCYAEAELEIKQYLTIGAIAWENNIEVTEEEIQQYCIDSKIVLEHLESQQKNQIECEILTNKVFRFLRESFGKE